jgi:hypothetical protein
MPNPQYGLLEVLPLLLLWLQGCDLQEGPRAVSTHGQIAEIVIDLEGGFARTSEWQAPIENCSTQEFHCLRIVGFADLAFPRDCNLASERAAWISPVGRFRLVAPQAHAIAGYGSYVSDNYPNAILYYENGIGFSEVRITRRAPEDSDFDFNDFQSRYAFSMSDGSDVFHCSR